MWVVFAVLWVGLVGLIWQSTIQASFEHGCWFKTAQVEPPAKPLTGPLRGWVYEPPNLCEHKYPSEMLPVVAEAVLIVPGFVLAFGLALRWAFMGFCAAKVVDGPWGQRARIRRAFGRPR